MIRITILILVFTLWFTIDATTIIKAKKLYNAGKLRPAKKIVQNILKKNSVNFKADALLQKIDTAINKREAIQLNDEAELEIKKGNFDKAYDLLGTAIILDSKNTKARIRYLAIVDIREAEYGKKENISNRNAETSDQDNKIRITFLEDGKGMLGRKVKILMANGFTIVGLIVKNSKLSLVVYSESTRREYEIKKSDIVVKRDDKSLK